MPREPFNPDLIAAPPTKSRSVGRSPLSVSQVTALIKHAIETGLPPTIHVIGEISNFKRHSSGHLYLTLKDASSEISCVMWRSAAARLKFEPTDGMEVVATGGVEVFERAGRYQLYIRRIEPRGVGALELAFRQLHEKLAAEGLFDARHKRPLPPYPARIVVVTSATGAAIGDIVRTIARRMPCVRVLLFPVRVQGPGSADQVASAIRAIDKCAESLGGVDLMIVGRGGGSLEDLWAFNEEVVARAIFDCRVPVISAVGHEVDVTISDLVADLRAATPTAAAELAVPVLAQVLADLAEREERMRRAIAHKSAIASVTLDGLLMRRPFADPATTVHSREQAVDETVSRIERGVNDLMNARRRRVDAVEPVIQRITPHRYLLHHTVVLRDLESQLRVRLARALAASHARMNELERRLERISPAGAIPRLNERVTGLHRRLGDACRHRLVRLRDHIRSREELLTAMSYRSVLGRGFSITRLKKGGRVVRSTAKLRDRERVVTEVCDGTFESEVINLHQLELFD